MILIKNLMSKVKGILINIFSKFYFLLLISYLILLIIQGFKNKKYNDFNSSKIIKERVLYEQFSYEIYNSINSPLILDLKIQEECEENYQPLNFLLKINPYYNFKSTISISHLFNNKFCIPIYEKLKNKYNPNELKYHNLLIHSININNIKNYYKNDKNSLNNICESGYKPCGILDTMNNILCFPTKYNCPLNDIIISKNKNSSLIDEGYEEINLNNSISIYLNTNENIERPIIITNFISYDRPWNHEYQKIVAYKDEKKKKEKDKKREQILFEDYDIFMRKVSFNNFSFIPLNDILIWEKSNDYLKKMLNELRPSESYYLFNKNYIGFKNYEELEKFKKLFKEHDYRNAPLFKFSKTLCPGLATIIINIFFIIILLFLLIISFFYDYEDDGFFIPIYFCIILSFIYFVVYISIYFLDKNKFNIYQFTFDAQMESVLNSFYKRNKQPVYLASIILIIISLLPHILIALAFFSDTIYNCIFK